MLWNVATSSATRVRATATRPMAFPSMMRASLSPSIFGIRQFRLRSSLSSGSTSATASASAEAPGVAVDRDLLSREVAPEQQPTPWPWGTPRRISQPVRHRTVGLAPSAMRRGPPDLHGAAAIGHCSITRSILVTAAAGVTARATLISSVEVAPKGPSRSHSKGPSAYRCRRVHQERLLAPAAIRHRRVKCS